MHVGAGASVGAIDMPIQRERHTQIPIVPGSGLKGVLSDLWNDENHKRTDEGKRLFGEDDNSLDAAAGDLIIGEARTVCFPVRSAKGAFAWLTSPLALARIARERGTVIELPSIGESDCLAGGDIIITGNGKKQVVLEEYCFQAGDLPETAVALLKDAFKDDPVWATLSKRLVIVSDGIFSHYCANACEVQQRIRINDDTGTVETGGLFNQENLPSETVLLATISERKPEAVKALDRKIEAAGNVLQIGGDETIGLGYCTVVMEGGRQ